MPNRRVHQCGPRPSDQRFRSGNCGRSRRRTVAEQRAVASVAPPAPQRPTVFPESADGLTFYIDGKQYATNDPPHFIARDFHLHQAHFALESVNGVSVKPYHWLDSTNIPNRLHNPDGSVTPGWIKILVDFRGLVIRGEFLYHCHILEHEDHGMMAKILVQ